MRRTAVALAFLLSACEGLIFIESPPDPLGPGPRPRPEIRLDGGGGQVPIPGTDGGWCDIGDTRPSAVYYGTREPTMLSMSEGQKLAVVMYRTGGWVCSGTVIADRWVLCAKHCNPSGGTLGEIHAGPDPDAPNTVIAVSRVLRHTGRDLLLLELSESISGRLPGIVPIAYYSATIDSSWRGRVVECAGYGTQEDGTLGERRFTAQPIADVDSTYVTVDGEGRHGLCGGDSGGPVFYQDTGGQIFVLGALTGGDPSCTGQDNYTRVDPAWLESNVGPPSGPPDDPCMGIDARGRCDGSTAQWCESGALRSEACAGGTTCGDGAEGYRCRTPEGPLPGPGPDEPCGALTIQGRCTDAGVAEWCEGGVIRRAYCSRCGLVCNAITDRGGAWCEEMSIPP